MARYIVHVHYDMVAHVEVEAESENEALELAEEEAENIPASSLECVGVKSCIVYVS